MADVKIKYALCNHTREAIYIKDANRGLKCNCSCPKCGGEMIAVQGESHKPRKWHFRHHEIIDCSGGQETAIHKLAKKIIIDNSQISIPDEILNYSQARQEEKLNSIIPDITVFANGFNVYIEIVVTNFVDRSKKEYYKNNQLKSFEINLSGVSRDITPKQLEELVLKTAERKKIFWEAQSIQNIQTNNQWFSQIVNFTKEHWPKLLIVVLIVFIPWYIKQRLKKAIKQKHKKRILALNNYN